MEKELTPEEKLLRLIKSSKKSEDKPRAASPQKEKAHPAQPAKKKFVKARGVTKVGPLTLINRILLGICSIVFIATVTIFVVRFNTPAVSGTAGAVQPAASAETGQEKELEAVGISSSEIRQLSYYADQVKQRKLFKQMAVKKPKPKKKTPKIKIGDLSKTLKLMGIIPGNPTQAIIEDSKTKNSSFVSEGDTIGDLTVEKIENGRVKLIYEEQSIFLSL